MIEKVSFFLHICEVDRVVCVLANLCVGRLLSTPDFYRHRVLPRRELGGEGGASTDPYFKMPTDQISSGKIGGEAKAFFGWVFPSHFCCCLLFRFGDARNVLILFELSWFFEGKGRGVPLSFSHSFLPCWILTDKRIVRKEKQKIVSGNSLFAVWHWQLRLWQKKTLEENFFSDSDFRFSKNSFSFNFRELFSVLSGAWN